MLLPTVIQTRVMPVSIAELRRDRRQRVERVAPVRQREADREQRLRLAFAGERGLGPLPLPTGQPTDDDPDQQEEQEIQPFTRVPDREREDRLDEQEVVEQERRDGGHDRRGRPERDRHTDHGQQVGG